MVEISRDVEGTITLKSEKRSQVYTLGKDPIYSFFTFKTSDGVLPTILEGKYRSETTAIDAFKKFERQSKLSQAKKRQIIREERECQTTPKQRKQR